MIYVFKVYVLVIAVIFGLGLMLLLTGVLAALVLKALRWGLLFGLAIWRIRRGESVPVSRHPNSKEVLHGGAA